MWQSLDDGTKFEQSTRVSRYKHGDVVQIVDTSGKTVNEYSYDEWGNITGQIEGTSNSIKYAGEVYDAETGLYYLRIHNIDSDTFQ